MERRTRIPYLVMIVLALAIAGLLVYIVPYRYQLNRRQRWASSRACSSV